MRFAEPRLGDLARAEYRLVMFVPRFHPRSSFPTIARLLGLSGLPADGRVWSEALDEK